MRATDWLFNHGLDIAIYIFSFENWADIGLFEGMLFSWQTAVKRGMESKHTEGIKHVCFVEMEDTYAHIPWTKISQMAKFKGSEVVTVLCR